MIILLTSFDDLTKLYTSRLLLLHLLLYTCTGMTYYNNLLKGVQGGYCTMNDVDAAVRNSLTVRFELGLFDPPASLGELATLVRNEPNEQNHTRNISETVFRLRFKQ
eukprot:COSAG06_NODE_4392_length_4305_cov_1.890157_8_plen_107_part_00